MAIEETKTEETASEEGTAEEVSVETPSEAPVEMPDQEDPAQETSEQSPNILPADPPDVEPSPLTAAHYDGTAPRLDVQGRAYATGKRKDAIARVWIRPGSGKITVNGKEMEKYFARPVLSMILRHPLALTKRESQYDVTCNVRGGGLSGQAGAVRHGLSKALTYYEPELRGILKKAGALTRDARVVERKKYGRRKARRSFQFSKR